MRALANGFAAAWAAILVAAVSVGGAGVALAMQPEQEGDTTQEEAAQEDGGEEGAGQDFAQGAQGSGGVCTPSEDDEEETWTCEAKGPGCGKIGNATRWITASAEYQALVSQTFHFASLQALSLARSHEPGRWAVAVDLDETVISNALYTQERERCGRGYSRESWADWSSTEQATPLPGAKAFIDLVYEQGGLVVGVTNRREGEAEWTQAVLDRHELRVEFVLFRGDAKDATGEKEPRWERVPDLLAELGYADVSIVMWMGDQITDFPDLDQSAWDQDGDIQGPFGTRYFVLPNPMYGEWEHTELR